MYTKEFVDVIAVHPKGIRQVVQAMRIKKQDRLIWKSYTAKTLLHETPFPRVVVNIILDYCPSVTEANDRDAVMNSLHCGVVVYFGHGCYHHHLNQNVGYHYELCSQKFGWAFCSGFALYNFINRIYAKSRGAERIVALKDILGRLHECINQLIIIEDFWCPQSGHDPVIRLEDEIIPLPFPFRLTYENRTTLMNIWDMDKSRISGRQL